MAAVFTVVDPVPLWWYAYGMTAVASIPAHISARQLRALGFYLPELVDDDHVVRRAAVGLDGDELLDDGTAGMRLRVLDAFLEPAAR